jgi:hypothetical protein
MSEGEILAALFRVNADRCKPPMDENEVRTIARSIASKSPDQITTAVVEDHAGQDGLDVAGTHEWLTSAEVFAKTDQVEYIVEDVMPAAQAGIVGGRYKSLKTATAVDLGISVATGTPFLNRFVVPKALPIGIMSAESGWPTLRERGIAVARSKGLELPACENLYWSTASPQLTQRQHLDALKRFIGDKQLSALLVDPVYLAMLGMADKASNVLAMGELLSPITRMIEQTHCSFVLLHHARKHRGQHPGDQFAPPELGELAFAGWAELARFWIMLAQRKDWNPDDGQHWLWLQTGGSAGHAGLWHLDVCEGTRSDPDGRRWEVSTVGATEGKQQEQAGKELAKRLADEGKIEADKQAIKDAARKFPEGETKNVLKTIAGLRTARFEPALSELFRDGELAGCFVTKAGKMHDGFRLAEFVNLGLAT